MAVERIVTFPSLAYQWRSIDNCMEEAIDWEGCLFPLLKDDLTQPLGLMSPAMKLQLRIIFADEDYALRANIPKS